MTESRSGALLALLAYSLLIAVAGVVTALNERFWGAPLGPVLGDPSLGGGLAAAGGAVGLGAVLHGLNVLSTRIALMRDLERELAELVRPLLGLGPWPLAAVSGVAEEWIFRGLLMPFSGLWLQGLIFGLLHWPGSQRMWPWTLWTLVMGWLLGAMTLYLGFLWPAMLTHAVINGLSLTRLSKLDL